MCFFKIGFNDQRYVSWRYGVEVEDVMDRNANRFAGSFVKFGHGFRKSNNSNTARPCRSRTVWSRRL